MADIILRRLGNSNVLQTQEAMRSFTATRTENTSDELWLVEHPPVFTLGRRNRREHLLDPGDIPVVQVDRGGHVTYHGPGQVVAYLLLDLKRKNMSIRQLVTMIENSIISLLEKYHIEGFARTDAPGVYVSDMKIASLGLRVSRGCCYHGLSLNVAMDLEPFKRIHPCGFPGLAVTQMSDQGGPNNCAVVAVDLVTCLAQQLGYDTINYTDQHKDTVPGSVRHIEPHALRLNEQRDHRGLYRNA